MSSSGAGIDIKAHARELEGEARQAVRKASPWIVRMGRFGLLAKGVVYLILGSLALQAAIHRGHVTDKEGVLLTVLRQPFGTLLLGLLAGGLLAYMIWRIVQALLNPEREPQHVKGWSKRIFRFGSGLVYGGLGLAAVKLLAGTRSDNRTPSDWTASLMAQPLGKWLVAAVGISIAGYGLVRIWKAWKGELKKQLVLDGYAARARAWILGTGRFGQAARGVVFAVIGTYAFFAGLHTNPHEAKGVAEALRTIAGAPYGPYLLAAVAVGLIAYGLFQFVEARYRRIRAD